MNADIFLGSFDIIHDVDIIMEVLTRLEIHRIKHEVSKVDPDAFFFVQSIKKVKESTIKQSGINA